jgi:hypothetical protein
MSWREQAACRAGADYRVAMKGSKSSATKGMGPTRLPPDLHRGRQEREPS